MSVQLVCYLVLAIKLPMFWVKGMYVCMYITVSSDFLGEDGFSHKWCIILALLYRWKIAQLGEMPLKKATTPQRLMKCHGVRPSWMLSKPEGQLSIFPSQDHGGMVVPSCLTSIILYAVWSLWRLMLEARMMMVMIVMMMRTSPVCLWLKTWLRPWCRLLIWWMTSICRLLSVNCIIDKCGYGCTSSQISISEI